MPPKNAKRVPDWSWLGRERHGADSITLPEARRAAGLSPVPGGVACPTVAWCAVDNSTTSTPETTNPKERRPKESQCTAKRCRGSPRCYNHLGMEKWTSPDAKEKFVASKLGPEPILRDADAGSEPAGLKNYGATCYANAFLQVWFNNVAFRNGVYAAVGEAVNPLHHLASIFAMLQYSQREVVDPGRLIESLRLNKGDQQDAAEFSKLFMSLLDDQFKRQESLRNFVNEQFSGTLEYRTQCQTCGYLSSTESPFLELEISLADKSTLKSRIEHMLLPERLDGANRYRCPKCDSLQPAIRSTHLKSLPPTLHFSLMRFVYDPYTESRKKSRAGISYPHLLELNGTNYALRGVVTHQGQSALHGHFTAQVYNEVNGEWYSCSDEEVTVVPATSQPAPKRMKLDSKNSEDKSKDAYMLVYRQVQDTVPAPPPPAIMEAIKADNSAAIAEVKQRSADRLRYETDFDSLRTARLKVMREIKGDDHVVPLAALSNWLRADTDAIDWEYAPVQCVHGDIDPTAQEVRLISDTAFIMLKKLHVEKGKLFPDLDICRECVSVEYQTRHARATRLDQVAQFQDFNQDVAWCDNPYILSQAWLKAWLGDKLPAGSSPAIGDYSVFCEHGKPGAWVDLKVCRVTPAALTVLQSAVGEFTVFQEKDELCSTCQIQTQQEDDSNSAWRIDVKDEKQISKTSRNVWHVFKTTNYVLPRSFAQVWNDFLQRPGPRPEKLDPELCQHGLLDFDPSLDEATYLNEAGWVRLCAIYGHDPSLGVSVQFDSKVPPGKKYSVKDVSVETCETCRSKRLSLFDKMWLPVVNGLDSKPTTSGRTTKSRTKQVQLEVSKTTTVHNIKCDVYEELRITPRSQEMYLNGRKLADDETMEAIGLLIGDHLNMVELHDVDDFGVDGAEGFGGSVLVGRKACVACTYSNEPTAIVCDMCETPLSDM